MDIRFFLAIFNVISVSSIVSAQNHVKQINCSTNPVTVRLEAGFNELRTATTFEKAPECYFHLKAEAGFVLEIGNPTVSLGAVWRVQKDLYKCQTGHLIVDPAAGADTRRCPSTSRHCEGGGCPERCPTALIGDRNGFASTAAPAGYRRSNPTYLLSNSDTVSLALCYGWNTGVGNGNVSIKIRTRPSSESVMANSFSQTYNSPWFPDGYVQSGQVYTYTLSRSNYKGETFSHVLIQFNDLDLGENELIRIGDHLLNGSRQRESIYLSFNVTTEYTLTVELNDSPGKWSRTLGWRFTVEYVNEDDWGYYDREPYDAIDTVSQYHDLKLSLRSHRIDITVDKLIDHLFVFSNLPPGIRLAVHVITFTQTSPEVVLMEIRDGRHSKSPLIANITSSKDLEKSQPKNGYVMSSGAYIRARCHKSLDSLLSVMVTPFLAQNRTVGVPQECCNFPTPESDGGGFLCSHTIDHQNTSILMGDDTMRCIPSESACDSVNNCGGTGITSEDERDTACRGSRLETFGMTARNTCRTDARNVLCRWGNWVKHLDDCSYHNDNPESPSITIIVGSMLASVAVILGIVSLWFKRRIVLQRQETERARRTYGPRHRNNHRQLSRFECHVQPRSLASSMEQLSASRSDIRLQMGALPPAYDQIRVVGKPPPMYRENDLSCYHIREDDEVSTIENPPEYNIAMTHRKADDLPSLNPNTHADNHTGIETPSSDNIPNNNRNVSDNVTNGDINHNNIMPESPTDQTGAIPVGSSEGAF